MMIKSSFNILWLILLISSISSIAQSDPQEIKNLSQKADVILSGKVTQKMSSWNESETRIYTKSTVQVDEFLKGSSRENTVEIVSPGGEVGAVGELYTHMPKFEINEEVLVFLKQDNKSTEYTILSGEAGKITIRENAETKEKVTSSNLPFRELKAQIKSYTSEQ